MQVQESVNAANFLSVGAATSKKGSEGEVGGSDFASFLNVSGNSDDKNLGGVSPEKELFPERNKTVVKDSDRKNDKADPKTDNKTDSKTVSTNTDNKVKRNLESNSVSAQNTETEEVSLEDISDVISAIEDILAYIMNKFDLAFEDVQSNFQQFGMEFDDLFSAEGLKTFFLNMESADVSALLTDENLNASLEDFISGIDDILVSDDVAFEEIVTVIDEEMISVEDFTNVQKRDYVQNDESESNNVSVVADNLNEQADSTIEVKVETDGSQNNKSSSKDSGKSDKNIETENRNTILQGINDAINNIEDATPVSETAARPVEIVDQIVEQIRVNINESNTSMEMQLYPEHLGRIQIHVISKDGVMTARIAAETETARQAIEAGLNNLKESLENQNLKVDAIEVMVSTTAFAQSDERQEQYQQQGTGKKGVKLGFADGDEDVPVDEIEEQKMQVEGSSVSYRA